jgi:hypothetical protein
MPEDERRSHNVIADPTVLEVVHVRAADADGADLDEHLSRAGIRDRALLDAHVARRVHHGGDVGTHESAPGLTPATLAVAGASTSATYLVVTAVPPARIREGRSASAPASLTRARRTRMPSGCASRTASGSEAAV